MLSESSPARDFLAEKAFVRTLNLEKRRTARSRQPFVFLLLESASLLKSKQEHGVSDQIVKTLSNSFRDTDIRGWYENGSAIGLIFTEIRSTDGCSIGNALVAKIHTLLARKLTAQQISQISLSFYLFPEDSDKGPGRAGAVLDTDSVRSRRRFEPMERR